METGHIKKNTRNPALYGRLLLSLILCGTIAALIGFQWNSTHLFNPDWHPHARFHTVQLNGLIIAMSFIGLWLVWRHSPEPHIGIRVVLAALLFFWGGEFYALLVPGTSPAYDLNNPNTFELFGISIYANLFFSGLMIALSVLGYYLINSGRSLTDDE